jgi:predicted enzyme related to lactoylglutathione lyase
MATRKPPSPGTNPEEGPLAHARIETVLLFTLEFDRMLRFYRDTLGLRVRYANDHFAELSAGGGAGISLHAGADASGQPDTNVMIEFIVKDVDSTVRALTARGLTLAPVQVEAFGKITHFFDPEGHQIGLEEPKRHVGRIRAPRTP